MEYSQKIGRFRVISKLETADFLPIFISRIPIKPTI